MNGYGFDQIPPFSGQFAGAHHGSQLHAGGYSMHPGLAAAPLNTGPGPSVSGVRKVSVKINTNKICCGRVLGAGGARHRALQRLHQVIVHCDKTHAAVRKITINISGLYQDVENAQRDIEECLLSAECTEVWHVTAHLAGRLVDDDSESYREHLQQQHMITITVDRPKSEITLIGPENRMAQAKVEMQAAGALIQCRSASSLPPVRPEADDNPGCSSTMARQSSAPLVTTSLTTTPATSSTTAAATTVTCIAQSTSRAIACTCTMGRQCL